MCHHTLPKGSLSSPSRHVSERRHCGVIPGQLQCRSPLGSQTCSGFPGRGCRCPLRSVKRTLGRVKGERDTTEPGCFFSHTSIQLPASASPQASAAPSVSPNPSSSAPAPACAPARPLSRRLPRTVPSSPLPLRLPLPDPSSQRAPGPQSLFLPLPTLTPP